MTSLNVLPRLMRQANAPRSTASCLSSAPLLSAGQQPRILLAPSTPHKRSSLPTSAPFSTSIPRRLDPSASTTSSERLAYLEPLSSTPLSTPETSEVDQHVALLTLNRPAAKNAISRALLYQLTDALEQAEKNDALRVLIVRSLVPGAFCSGADLKERKTMSQTEVDAFLLGLRKAMGKLENLEIPTIAALDGLAMGGGLELALCADVRTAGRATKNVGLTETRLGIIPGAGGTHRLTRLVGPSTSKSLIFSARLLDAQQCFDLGIVDRLADAGVGAATGDDAEGGLRVAVEMARAMAHNGPLALRAAKKAIDGGLNLDTEAALDLERACYEHLLHSEDRLEGLRAFAEKRKPKYIGK